MKTFTVGVVWTVMGHYTIKAESEEDARLQVEELPLPTNSEYLEGSFSVDTVEETP